jgi:hypothetical protein
VAVCKPRGISSLSHQSSGARRPIEARVCEPASGLMPQDRQEVCLKLSRLLHQGFLFPSSPNTRFHLRDCDHALPPILVPLIVRRICYRTYVGHSCEHSGRPTPTRACPYYVLLIGCTHLTSPTRARLRVFLQVHHSLRCFVPARPCDAMVRCRPSQCMLP